MRDGVGMIGGSLKLVAGLVFALGAIPMLAGGSWGWFFGLVLAAGVVLIAGFAAETCAEDWDKHPANKVVGIVILLTALTMGALIWWGITFP